MAFRAGFAARRAIVAQPHKTLDHWWDTRRITSTTQQTLTDGGRNATEQTLTRGADATASSTDPTFTIGGPITNGAAAYCQSAWTPAFAGGLFIAVAVTGDGTKTGGRTIVSSESASVNGMLLQVANTSGIAILFIGDGVLTNRTAFLPGNPDISSGRQALGILVAADGLSARLGTDSGFGDAVDLTGYAPTHAPMRVGTRGHANTQNYVGSIHQVIIHNTAISETDALNVLGALKTGDLR